MTADQADVTRAPEPSGGLSAELHEATSQRFEEWFAACEIGPDTNKEDVRFGFVGGFDEAMSLIPHHDQPSGGLDLDWLKRQWAHYESLRDEIIERRGLVDDGMAQERRELGWELADQIPALIAEIDALTQGRAERLEAVEQQNERLRRVLRRVLVNRPNWEHRDGILVVTEGWWMHWEAEAKATLTAEPEGRP